MVVASNSPASASPSGSIPAPWLTPGRFALGLCLLLFAAFPTVILGQQTFVYRDFGLFGYPLAHFHRDQFWQGQWPLWNPYHNCGLPFLAQWNTLTLYPLSLFYLLFPLPWSLGWFCLGHLLLAGLNMFFLAQRWTANRLAAAAAGMAFGFNGLTFHFLMWPNNLAALAWMPLVVLAAELAWQKGGRWVGRAAVIGAVQMLAGAPELILFTWFITGCFWLNGLVVSKDASTAIRQRATRFLTLIPLVTGLAAVQLLPFFQLLGLSHRDLHFGGSRWAMPGWGWANFLLPLLGSAPSTHGVFTQPDQYWTSSYYLNLGILALALAALWRVRRAQVWQLGLIATAGFLLALGDSAPFYAQLRRAIPWLGWMRFPIKFVVLTIFCLPLLAALAMAWFQALPAPLQRREQWRWGGVVLVLAALIGALLGLAWAVPLSATPWRVVALNGVARLAFLGLFGGLFLSYLRPCNPPTRWLAPTALLCVIGLDALTHAPSQNPTAAPWIYRVPVPQLAPLPRLGQGRAMLAPADERRLEYVSVPDPQEDYLRNRLTLFADCNLLDGIPKVNGFYSLYLRQTERALALLRAAPALTNRTSGPLADFLGVSHTTLPGKPYQWIPRPSFHPLITAGQQPRFAEFPIGAGADATSLPDLHRVVFLPPAAQPSIRVSAETNSTVRIVQVAPHWVEAEVEAQQPAMVVHAQAWHPAWQVRVDDHPVRLWPANHGFQALEMPAGRHRIVWCYQDRQFQLGAVISLITLLICWRFRR